MGRGLETLSILLGIAVSGVSLMITLRTLLNGPGLDDVPGITGIIVGSGMTIKGMFPGNTSAPAPQIIYHRPTYNVGSWWRR